MQTPPDPTMPPELCTKCQAPDLARVTGETNLFGAGSNISLAPHVARTIPVTRIVCLTCGFIESWICDPADLAKLRDSQS